MFTRAAASRRLACDLPEASPRNRLPGADMTSADCFNTICESGHGSDSHGHPDGGTV